MRVRMLWTLMMVCGAGVSPALAAGLVARAVLERGMPKFTLLNVNVPNRPFAEVLGVREAHLARYGEVWVNNADRTDGDLRLTFDGGGREPDPDADVALATTRHQPLPVALVIRPRRQDEVVREHHRVKVEPIQRLVEG